MSQTAASKQETLLDLILRLEETYRTFGNAKLSITPDGYNEHQVKIEKTDQGFRLIPRRDP
jgi:hypothetical protein